MTSMELNAELFRQLSLIADDEALMRKAVKAITRIVKQKEETEYISKDEILEGIDAGLREVKLTKEGKLKPKTIEEFLNE